MDQPMYPARRPPRPVLSESDRAIWAAFTRTIPVLRGRALPAPDPLPVVDTPPPIPPASLPPRAVAPSPAKAHGFAPIVIGAAQPGVDAATANRLRKGKTQPTRTLDLHGHTAQRAFHALHGFLRAAQSDGVRCVEVITGRGNGETGVIRRELPFWLNGPEFRHLVLLAAHPHAANQGSVRLLLRRVRVG